MFASNIVVVFAHVQFLFLIISIVPIFIINGQANADDITSESPAEIVFEETTAQPAEQRQSAKEKQPEGCSEQDHRSCDDVCKGDSFWYGYCASWDGRDLECTCMAYKTPLDGKVCGPERQEKCANECSEKGQQAGGYCAVFPSSEEARGEPKCMCFDKPALS